MAALAELAGHAPKVSRKTVLTFDICSSTAILEDLVRTESAVRWERVLGELKRYMWQFNDAVEFATYKWRVQGLQRRGLPPDRITARLIRQVALDNVALDRHAKPCERVSRK